MRFLLALGLLLASPAWAAPLQQVPDDTTPTTFNHQVGGSTGILDPNFRANPFVPNPDGSVTVKNGVTTGLTAIGGAYTIGTSSAALLPNSSGRKLLAVHNESTTASIAICFGATCTAALNTAGNWTIPAGQTILWNTAGAVPTDAVNAIASVSAPATVEVH